MSIINDALKKVQNKLDKQDNTNPPSTGTHNMENQNPPASNNSPNSPTPVPPNPVPTNPVPPGNTQKDLTQFLPKKEKASTSEPVILTETIKPERKAIKIPWNQILLGVFSLAIIAGAGSYLYTYLTSKEVKKNYPNIPVPPKIQVSLPSAQEIKEAILPAETPASKAKKQTQGGLALNGIVASGDRFAALINDKIYEVGDTVEGKEIISITEKAVELRDSAGATTTMSLK